MAVPGLISWAGPVGAEPDLKDKTPSDSLVQSQRGLLLNGNFSDCSVKCEGMEWNTHRCILCPRSAYFSSAFSGSFQEGTTSIISMDDDEPYTIEGLLFYLYTFVYPTWTPSLDLGEVMSTQKNASKCQIPGTKWETHLGMFKLADKLGLEHLKSEAQTHLRLAIEDEWNVGNFHELLEQLWEMDQAGVPALKDTALKTISANAAQLLVGEDFKDHLVRIPLFTASLVGQLVQERIVLNDKILRRRTAF